MKKLTALNKKTNQEVVAVEQQDGRFEITVEGEVKTVAASTFKRWYKVTGEVAEVAPVEETPVAVAEETSHVKASITDITAEDSKCQKLRTIIQYGDAVIDIVEYDGYVCEVTVVLANGQVYNSAKMSIKDAIENGLGLTGDTAKAVKKLIVNARKNLKQSLA